ncbi:MAG: hypothetical protein IH987_15120 [Planctomycetes bacterium]|nr:hypothetical protein [Planctomycetota bacterium]
MTRGMKYVCAAVGALVWVQSANAFDSYRAAWEAKYPTSTLPERMTATTGAVCHICHHPPSRDVLGNCYRMDLKALLDGGATIQQALDQLDGMDSDGDGVPNGVEATTPRDDLPGEEVGYNMGLVGPAGVDPCADIENFGVSVTNQLETPPVPVPAVSEWGLLALSLVVLVAGTMLIRLRVRPSPVVVRR